MWIQNLMLGGAAFGAFATAAAQAPLDFDALAGVESPPTVQVDLGKAMLGFAAAAARESDPAAATMIEGLNGVRLRVYEDLEGPSADALGVFVDQASNALVAAGWDSIVQVHDDDARIRVFARVEQEAISGMTVLIVDSGEAVLIDIDGRIDPTQIGGLAGAMGLGGMLGSVFSGAAAIQQQAAAHGAGAPPGANGPAPGEGEASEQVEEPGSEPNPTVAP